MKKSIQYSVIIPVFKSANILSETVKKTVDFFKSHQFSFEILLVNDGSPDDSWAQIQVLANEYEEVRGINLLRNYGQHTAVLCGINHGIGQYFITMDDDLQNPPHEIIKLINKVEEGYDLVFGKFRVKRHGIIRKLGSKLVNYLNRIIFGKPKNLVISNFRIFSKDVAQRISNHKTVFPYIQGLVLMYSSNPANVETEHHPRREGHSNYSLIKIIKLMARLLFNYSSFPLKVLTFAGMVLAIISFFIGVYVIAKNLFFGIAVPGWTSLVVLLSFFNGFLILMLGILGEYVSRILDQVSISQPYLIKEETNG